MFLLDDLRFESIGSVRERYEAPTGHRAVASISFNTTSAQVSACATRVDQGGRREWTGILIRKGTVKRSNVAAHSCWVQVGPNTPHKEYFDFQSRLALLPRPLQPRWAIAPHYEDDRAPHRSVVNATRVYRLDYLCKG